MIIVRVIEGILTNFVFLSDGVLFREIKSTGKEDKCHRRIPVPNRADRQRVGQCGKTCAGTVAASCHPVHVVHPVTDILMFLTAVCVSGGDESGSGSYPARASVGCWAPLCHGSDYPAL